MTEAKRTEMDFVIQDDQSQSTTQERDIVPAGVHEMVIKHVEEGPNEYKTSDENPEGLCLKLRLATSQGNYRFVFDDIPKHLGWRAKQLAESLGIEAVDGKISLDPGSIEGLTLSAEISHYTSKAGKVSAVVKKYLPPVQQAKPASKPASKPARKPAPVAVQVTNAASDDDIPF